MAILDLRKGFTENQEYKAFKFHGGEVHFKLTRPEVLYTTSHIKIISRITNSDELMLLILAIDTLKKDANWIPIEVIIPYMPYQQADRNFSVGECFSLKTITNILNSLDVSKYTVFDPHSDVTPALLKNCNVVDNSDFIYDVLVNLRFRQDVSVEDTLCILSPDAGAYKKIGKLCDKIGWRGELVNANKHRNISNGNIASLELSTNDFKGKDVLIIDDICVGGRTFIELSKKLREKNVGKVYLAVSHGIFSNSFGELKQHIDGIFVTDSYKELTQEYNDGYEIKPLPLGFLTQIKLDWNEIR